MSAGPGITVRYVGETTPDSDGVVGYSTCDSVMFEWEAGGRHIHCI